jgi:YidC/Oxa1 family membrane protein insertase
MEKRVFLALFLSFLVLYAYQAFFVKPVPKRPAPASATSAGGERPGQPTTSAPAASAASATVKLQPNVPPPAEVATLVADARERDITVETDLVTAVFTTRGGGLKSWRLKKFHDLGGRPLELVPQNIPPDQRPLLPETDDPVLTTRLHQALFRPSAETITATTQPATLTFEYQDQSGLRASRSIAIRPGSYILDVTSTVSMDDRPVSSVLSLGAGLGDPVDTSARGARKPGGLLIQNRKAQRPGISNIAKQSTYQGDFAFAGIEDQYFVSAVVRPGPVTVEYAPVIVPADGSPQPTAHEFVACRVRFAAPSTHVRVFFGPKEFDVLAATDQDFVRAIDFGIFSFLVVPLLRSLKWINGYVGNYGWSIILLTVFINALMFPLRHKSVVSMRRMQELQPQVKAIQDRYGKLKATDPERQKMNTELMNLYREKGVNPASGCIPMLLTLPVLYAFYSLLAGAIEIRGEPFIGWIHDLSAPDPLYITPIAMAITMFIQQKMTPSTADPAQQRVMLIMPLMLGFLFLRASSGLVLYWLVSNLWAIGQQYVTNRIIGPPVVRAVRPPAERRVRAANSGPAKTPPLSSGE